MSDFRIEIETVLKGNPTSELESLQVAIKDALGSYAQMEKQLAKTTKQLASTRDQIGNVREQLDEARAGGDAAGVEKLEAKLAKLIQREQKLVGAAGEARAALQNQEDSIRELAGSLEELRAAEEGAAAAAEDNAQGQRDLKAGLKGLGGPLGETISLQEDLADTWNGLVTQMGGPGAAALGIAAAGLAMLAAAAISAAVAFTKLAISQANQARDAKLSLEAMLGNEFAAKRVSEAFGSIISETGSTSARLSELTKSLKDAGVPISQMPAALRAIALQEAAIGSDGTQELIDALKDGKKSVGDLAKEVDGKFGDVVKKRVLGLDQQMTILGEHFSSLFDGINIEPILEGFARLVGLLDSNSESGRAIKAIFETMLAPLGDAESIFIGIERFLLGMEIATLKVAIGIKRIAKELGLDTSGMQSVVDLADLGAVAIYALAAAVGAVVTALGVMAAIAAAPFVSLYNGVNAAITVFNGLASAASAIASQVTSALDGIVSWFRGVSLSEMGSQMIAGLVNGIKSGAGAVIEALGGIVDSAVNAAKSKLGIASPSRVMAEIGGYTAEGFTVGVDDGTADAQASMEALVAPPDPAVAGVSGGKGGALDFTGATFVFHGVADAEQATVRFEEMLVGLLEGQLLQAGSAA